MSDGINDYGTDYAHSRKSKPSGERSQEPSSPKVASEPFDRKRLEELASVEYRLALGERIALVSLLDAYTRLRLERDGFDAQLHMAVARLEGIVEGNPTGRHNFLQRIDELIEIEKRYRALICERCGGRLSDGFRHGEEWCGPPKDDSGTPCKWCGRVRDLHYDFGAMWCEETREGHKFEAGERPPNWKMLPLWL